ncbi:hypothetical protein ACMWPE_25725, partial [Escherichia coli]
GDCLPLVRALQAELGGPLDAARLAPWWARVQAWRAQDCLGYTPAADAILPQHLMSRLNAALAGRDAIVST